jgi:hypothetical protein
MVGPVQTVAGGVANATEAVKAALASEASMAHRRRGKKVDGFVFVMECFELIISLKVGAIEPVYVPIFFQGKSDGQ